MGEPNVGEQLGIGWMLSDRLHEQTGLRRSDLRIDHLAGFIDISGRITP